MRNVNAPIEDLLTDARPTLTSGEHRAAAARCEKYLASKYPLVEFNIDEMVKSIGSATPEVRFIESQAAMQVVKGLAKSKPRTTRRFNSLNWRG